MASAPHHLRIFLASPGDVTEEREIALQVLDNLPYDPLLLGKVTIRQVAWDKRGAGAPILAGVTPQKSIEAGLPRPGECDIVVVIFWSRMGTPLPPPYQKEDGSRYESGTEWEYEDAVSAFRQRGSPSVLLYRRKQPVSLDLDDLRLDERREQYEKVKRFFAGLQSADGSASSGYAEYGVPGDFRDRLQNDLKHIVARILDSPAPATSERVALPEPWRGSPFPGLRAFTADDAPIFFGREREIDALTSRILEHPFVAVVGASGSGKSSLVAAGVIPRLQLSAGSAGTPEWLVLQLTPDRLGTGDPFASLAAAILHALPQTQQKGLATRLREAPELLANLLPPRTLVFVDQFEELFTTVQPSLRAPFVDLLQRMRVVITVRADFYGNCVEMPALAQLVENSTYPLAAPSLAALYEMITRPAARAALAFEEGLAQRILDDTGQEPGALALMAYTLDELYRRGLTHTAYEELEGVQGAIGKRSESVFSALGNEERAALPHVFRELVEVDERGTATRQRAPLDRVATTPAARGLTEALTHARLLVPTRGENNEPVVEVAHEALFRSWPRLADWISEAQGDLRLLRQVRTAAIEWDRCGRRDHFLWPHERLEPVYAMCDRFGPHLESVVSEFIRPEFERIVGAICTGLSEVRERASIERLVEIGPPAARSLVESLHHARTQEAREDIYDALSRLGNAAVPHLLDAVTSTGTVSRSYAVQALSYVNPGAGAHLLPGLLTDEDSAVRAAAALLVGYARANREIPTLCTMLNTDKPNVWRAAMVALATFDSPTTVESLLAAVELKYPYSYEAMDLIADLTGHNHLSRWEHYDRLEPLVRRNPVLRKLPALIRAATVLAQVPAQGSVGERIDGILGVVLSAKVIEASVSADTSNDDIGRLFEILVNARSYAITDLLSSADARLRHLAVRAIGDLAAAPIDWGRLHLGFSTTDRKVRDRLEELLQHDDEQTRYAARVALAAIGRMPLIE
jgi:HEAT repeat protein